MLPKRNAKGSVSHSDRKISDGIQIYEANEPENLEPYPGFDNYYKITVLDHVSMS